VTSFIIEHQCPQCGAPAELTETDRLLSCGFCRVKSYLTAPGFFRYVIPHRAPEGKELIYIPYWRFKGMLFSCLPRKIAHRFIDTSYQAVASVDFPFNIGFRGQTQKLRFAASVTEGTFVKPGVSFDDIFPKLRENYSPTPSKSILHQEFIGETRSLIYSPFYFDTKLMDGVTNRPVSKTRREDLPDNFLQADRGRRPINFLAALCPNCGRDLDGERDCLALTCENCQSAWWEKRGKLVQVKTIHFPEKGDHWVYLPFWRIKADVSPVCLETYADLVKAANLPRVVQPGWEKVPFRFWNPAFKVRPQNYLTIATNVTLKQPVETSEPGPPKGRVHSVTLPLGEALETLKLNIVNFLRPLERRTELIPEIDIQPRRYQLVYIPFQDTRLELIQPRLNLAVNKNVLSHAKNL
jgi:ribosomal protein S27AE